MSIPASPGIYRITCTVTGKFYIGSAADLRERWRTHRKELTQDRHHNPKLQATWNKYGPETFIFEVLELVLVPELLTAREQYYLDTLKPFGKRGFNIAIIAGSSLGVRRSSETIERMRLAASMQVWTEEARRNASQSQQGRRHRPETIERMRISALARPPRSLETCAKMSIAKKGKPSPHRGKKMRDEVYAHHLATHEYQKKSLIVTSPDGTEQTIHGIRQFCKEHALDRAALMRVAQGENSHHKGWKARFPDADVI